MLALPADLDIDPSLRKSLDALAVEHLARMETIVRQWTREEAAV